MTRKNVYMKFVETRLPGVVVIEPKVFEDERGFFMETWRESLFRDAGIDARLRAGERQPVAAPQYAARAALPGRAAAGQAGARGRGRGLRRGRGPAPRLAQLPGQWVGDRALGREQAPALDSAGLRARLPRHRATPPSSSTSAPTTTRRSTTGRSAGTIPTIGIEWPLEAGRRAGALGEGRRVHRTWPSAETYE